MTENSETPVDIPAPGSSRRPADVAGGSKPKGLFGESLISIAAFVLSLMIALGGLFTVIQGSTVAVLDQQEVYIYKDGTDNSALLAIAVEVPIVNTSTYNDVLVDAEVEIPRLNATLDYEQSTVQPRRFKLRFDTIRFCDDQDQDCLPFQGMAMISNPEELISVSAGAAHSRFYKFRFLCPRNSPDCSAYSNFDASLRALGNGPIDIVVRMKFFSDGTKTLRCRIPVLHGDYVRSVGYQIADCQRH